jgi:hypothetical protein
MDSVFSQINPVHPILIVSSHTLLGLPSGLFPSGFPTKISHLPHALLMSDRSHSPFVHKFYVQNHVTDEDDIQ